MKSELLTRSVAKVLPKQLAEEKIASGKKLRVYWGIDPTGSAMHIGHSIPMRKLQQFADEGHEAILLIGSFTAMLGDPSDKESMRKPLTKKQVEENFKSYKKQADKILDFKKIKIVYNHKWLEKLNLENIINFGSLFTVQQMEERDAFAKRLKSNKPLGVHEFMYPLMVGYDSVYLDVDCEIGGTDQEFNMLAGRTMQKAMGKREKFVLTTKLVEGTDGRLMSKTYDNCVYLNDDAQTMFGKTMSLQDNLMENWFECFTNIPMEEVKKMVNSDPRNAKVQLAKEIVAQFHGKDEADKAANEFNAIFRDKGVPEDMPEITAKKGELLLDVLIRSKTIESKSDGRRLIEQGGIKLNNQLVKNIDLQVQEGMTPETLPAGRSLGEDLAKGVIVKVGKRKFLKIIIK